MSAAIGIKNAERPITRTGTLGLILAFSLVGCFANLPYIAKEPEQTTYVYADGYDQVWGVLVGVLHADGLSLEVIDKESGVISGVKRLEPTTMDMLMNYSARVATNITVQKVSNGTQVRINSINERKHEEHDWRPAGQADAYSATLFESINQQLSPAGSGRAVEQKPIATQSEPIIQSSTSITNRESIREAQKILNSLGYDAGPEDGIMGSRTANALMLYQSKSGLVSSGRLDDQTFQNLREAATKAGVNPASGQSANSLTGNTGAAAAATPRGESGQPSADNSTQPIGSGTVTVATELKLAADPFSKSIVALPSGARIEILNVEGDWIKARFSGQIGYVLAGFVAQK